MVSIEGRLLSIDDVVQVARKQEVASLSEEGRAAVAKSRETLENLLKKQSPVYGINTGFGIFAERRIPPEDSARLSRNLILSHAVGSGAPLDAEVVRAAMLVRANTLSKGFSGVRLAVIETLLEMLNRNVTPVVPSQGSLGSSGDLCPLSHMALVFTTDERDLGEESGFAYFDGAVLDGKTAMQRAGLERVHLGPKEGLAINNGATFSAALGALAAYDARYLLDLADVALAMSLEALLGCSAAFDARLHQARGHAGQMHSAARVLALLQGSSLLDAACRIQDAYSLRCAPQVQGAARDTLEFVWRTLEIEINAATDNPLLFEPGDAISGGNFHGEPVGMALDYLGIAMSEVASISERRVYRLTDGKINGGLPPMLVDTDEDAGLNSGLMIPQYTAASIVMENQTLASPDSVLSLPTSGGQEDHNANAMNAAKHARTIVQNTAQVLAIELYTAARALDLRLRLMPGAKLGAGTARAYAAIRAAVPYQPGDAWWGPEIEQVRALVDAQAIPVTTGEDTV